jgi:hypothetical protein
MKNLVVSFCLFALSASTFAVTDSYVARLNDEGEYCAKVNVGIVTPYFKTKCYTLEQWKENGFTVEIQ